MDGLIEDIQEHVYAIGKEVVLAGPLEPGDMLVIGASTSEIAGQHIGTAGSADIARHIVRAIERLAKEYGLLTAYQCCEHLNRALVVSRRALSDHVRTGEVVSVVPVAHAGGALAACAYTMLDRPVVAASVCADAAIDIGETLIGMHVRAVAVPMRPRLRMIGAARVTAATRRPKLIGGARAVYG
ncbi:MAG: TIGR01440 family protein [Paenibacillaceae bacterium]|nr:TIGR01440 family protein [Paenibacillaceae bacterium]